MVLLVPARGLAVTAAPGTGSTSLLAHLSRAGSAVLVPADDVVVDGAVVVDAKHAPLRVVVDAGVVDRAAIADLDVLTGTRNPFDFWAAEWHRTRTRWRDLLADPSSWVHRQAAMRERIHAAVSLPFAAWLRAALEDHVRAGRTMHLNPGHIAEATHVVRMEQLDDDLRRLCPQVADLGPVPHVNATPDRPAYRQMYDDASRRLVARVHAPDLERFGYSF